MVGEVKKRNRDLAMQESGSAQTGVQNDTKRQCQQKKCPVNGHLDFDDLVDLTRCGEDSQEPRSNAGISFLENLNKVNFVKSSNQSLFGRSAEAQCAISSTGDDMGSQNPGSSANIPPLVPSARLDSFGGTVSKDDMLAAALKSAKFDFCILDALDDTVVSDDGPGAVLSN